MIRLPEPGHLVVIRAFRSTCDDRQTLVIRLPEPGHLVVIRAFRSTCDDGQTCTPLSIVVSLGKNAYELGSVAFLCLIGNLVDVP